MNRLKIIGCILCTAVCLVAGTRDLSGQVISSYGAKAGIALANQSYRFTPIDYTLETQSIATPSLGLFLEAFGRGPLGLQFDLCYAVKGSKTSTRSITVNHLDNDRIIVNEGEPVTSTFRMIEISPMARYRMGTERLTPYFLLGPRIDFVIHYETDSEFPLEEYYNYIVGLNGGAGIEYSTGAIGLFLEVQYQPDLSPLTNKEPLLVNNGVVLFTFGIRYKSGSL